MKKGWKKKGAFAVVLILVFAVVCLWYINDYYKSDVMMQQYFQDDSIVEMEENDYGLYMGEDQGAEQCVDGVNKAVVEGCTSSDEIGDLIQILNFSTIVGNEVCMTECFEGMCYVKYYGMGKATYNDISFEVPIYGYRPDRNGRYNYGVIYPELQVKSKFDKGFKVRGPKMDAHLKSVLVKDRYFYILMTLGGKEQALKFSLEKFEKVVYEIE